MTASKRVLIVEDEPLIAMMLEDFLEVLDRRVAGVAETVAAALAVVEAGGVDAAILDVNLRGGERSTAVAEALAMRGIPFVFATGGSGDSLDPRFQDRPTLMKPFTMDGVAQVLDAL